jgi:hypothetical protein
LIAREIARLHKQRLPPTIVVENSAWKTIRKWIELIPERYVNHETQRRFLELKFYDTVLKAGGKQNEERGRSDNFSNRSL